MSSTPNPKEQNVSQPGATSPPTYAFVSLGCPKNLVDSEKMLGHLALDGYTLVSEPEGADFVVVNTCGFIEQSRAESKAREMDYGADVGTITVTVFGERQGERAKSKLPTREDESVYVVSHIARPSTRPQNANALIDGLLEDANRNLIVVGERVKSTKVVRTKFDMDPVPLMTLTVVYHKP